MPLFQKTKIELSLAQKSEPESTHSSRNWSNGLWVVRFNPRENKHCEK